MKNLYKNKKVLVFGLGLNQGGVGSAKFFAKAGAKVRVTDLKTAEDLKPSLEELKGFPDIEYTLGEHRNEDIDFADLIIKNPGVKPGNPYMEYAQKKGKRVEMDMGIFLQFVSPSQIVGVTGTKGKSTTSSLIYEILKNAEGPERSRRVVFAGNIGKSVLDTIEFVTPETLVVLEISSFQLEAFDQHKVSPKYAVITNITPDHLNYYKTMEEYTAAKRVIAKYQTKDDFLFIRTGDPAVDRSEFLNNLNGQVIRFTLEDLPQDLRPNLKGEHNLFNIAAVYQVGKIFGINSNLLFKTLTSFKGVPFRMEAVKMWNGITIINDTTATGPDAGIKALQTFPNCILITGGMNKNMPYGTYAKTVDDKAKRVYFLIGDSTDEIKKLMKRQDKIIGVYGDLEKLLKDVKSKVESGDVVLFSPAATSFNLFQNEFDRGRKFNQAVEKIFN